jgi:hypothetical protein
MRKKDFADKALNKVLASEDVDVSRSWLSSMALKCNDYQQFYPGFRFVESLANWLNQFEPEDAVCAFEFVKRRLIYISEAQIRLLVESAFSSHMRPKLFACIASSNNIEQHKVKAISQSLPYQNAINRSLFLGLSDGARTDVFRRYNPHLDNEQVWLTYSISEEKYKDFSDYLTKCTPDAPTFEYLWLMDDFSASGKSFLRKEDGKWKGKIVKTLKGFLERENAIGADGTIQSSVLAPKCRIYIILYIASCRARIYFEEQIKTLWSEKEDFANRFEQPELIIVQELTELCLITDDKTQDSDFIKLIDKDSYYDHAKLFNKASEVGGTDDVRYGFADGRLPLVLGHNTPNNSVSLLWAFETAYFVGLFPRVSRH